MDGSREVRFTQEILRDRCKTFISGLLDTQKDKIDADCDFDRLGLDSAMAVAMIFDLEEWMGAELSPSLLFDHSSINRLARHLAESHGVVAAAE